MKNKPLPLLAFFLLTANILHAQSWKTFADSAHIFQQQKDNGKAIEYFKKANALLTSDSATTITRFIICNETADLLVTMGKYADALPFYASSKELIEKLQGKEAANYALSCHNLGRLNRLLGQYQNAEDLLLEAKRIREKITGKENADYAHTVNNLAILYAEVGQFNDAGPYYKEALDIRKRVLGVDHIDYAASCNNLGIYYVLTGQPYLTEPLYLEAKRIREKTLGKEHPFYAASCNNLAALYLDLGQYTKAEPLYTEARQIRERTLGKEHPDYAASCDNLAILYMDIGQYETAEALYKEARLIREKVLGKKHIEYAKGCNNLALLYKILGQYEKSAALFIEAKEIFAAAVGTSNFEYGKCCNNLGAVYMDMGDNDKAALLYEEAKQVWTKVLGKEHPEYAKSCHNLAVINYLKGNNDEAIALFNEANGIREKALGKEHPDYAEGCDNLAAVYQRLGDHDKAIALFLLGKQIREKVLGTAHPFYLQSCINLSNAYRSSGNHAMALNYYTEAFSSQQILLKKIFRFTTEPEKQAYLNKINEYRSCFLSFSTAEAYEKGAVYAYEVSLANKNLVLNASQRLRKIISNANDTTLLHTYNSWIDIREQLAFWYSRAISDRKAQTEALEEKANELEKKLIQLSAPFRQEQQENSWIDIRQSLKPGEAAIEFSSFKYHDGEKWLDSTYYIAVIIRNDKSSPELIRLFEKRELDALIGRLTPGQQLVNMLYSTQTRQAAGKASLYKLIWQPLERSLAGINTIYFSPAGELYKISFAALPAGNAQVLSDKYKLIQLNSTATLKSETATSIAATDKLALYGGIQYEADSISIRRAALSAGNNDLAKISVPENLLRSSIGDFHYLAESAKEVTAIGNMARQKNYAVTLANGITATEESIKHLSGHQSPAVIHIATHGFFFADPTATTKTFSRTPFQQSDNPLIRSGLALAGANNAWRRQPISGVEDGILTAYEVSNLYLPNTKLAVLSACETGLGYITGSEGVYGLQRSFNMAGAENLVMSLWKVPDAESSEFMQEFYKNLFAQQTIHTAFYNAQTTIKNKYRNEPYKWAAWVLVR